MVHGYGCGLVRYPMCVQVVAVPLKALNRENSGVHKGIPAGTFSAKKKAEKNYTHSPLYGKMPTRNACSLGGDAKYLFFWTLRGRDKIGWILVFFFCHRKIGVPQNFDVR